MAAMLQKTVENKKQALIAELVAARLSIVEVVKQLPPDSLDEVFLGVWSVKDLLAHLIGWDYTNLQAIQEVLDGKRPTFFQYYDKDWQSYNARLVQQYKVEPFERLLNEATTSHQRLVGFLEALPARDVLEGKARGETGRTISVRFLLRAEAGDERKHAEQVRARSGALNSGS